MATISSAPLRGQGLTVEGGVPGALRAEARQTGAWASQAAIFPWTALASLGWQKGRSAREGEQGCPPGRPGPGLSGRWGRYGRRDFPATGVIARISSPGAWRRPAGLQRRRFGVAVDDDGPLVHEAPPYLGGTGGGPPRRGAGKSSPSTRSQD